MDIKLKKQKKVVYPSKTTMNLAMKEKSPFRPSRLIPPLLLVLALLGVFGKFAVVDRLAAVQEAQAQLAQLQEQRDTLLEATADFDDLSLAYAKYSHDWMTPEMLAAIPGGEILDLVQQYIMPVATVRSVDSSGSIIALQLGGLDLAGTSQLVDTLYALPTITDVQVNTAESKHPSAKVNDVTLVITMGTPEEGGKS